MRYHSLAYVILSKITCVFEMIVDTEEHAVTPQKTVISVFISVSDSYLKEQSCSTLLTALFGVWMSF